MSRSLRLSQLEQLKLLDRLLKKTIHDPKKGCLVCQGGVNSKGCKTVSIKGRNYYVHRVVFALVKERIIGNNQVHHSCDTRRCMEPNHLYQGTSQDNYEDMRLKGNAYAYGNWVQPKEFDINEPD